jgi:NO-binding membrane sensor protein with MHYT domain
VLSGFFLTGEMPLNQLFGTYDLRLVILSYLVAVFSSYIALDFTGRLRDQTNTNMSIMLWFVGGSIAMGAGIWSMHFIGMLSFSMPTMIMNYDPYWTMFSLFVAIIASSFAFFLLKSKIINITKLVIGGIILGIAIASMHYAGMEAMKINMDIYYLPKLFFLSIFIAIIASEAALWLAIRSNQVVSKIRVRLKVISACIMGLAIWGMHYTGMASAVFIAKNSHAHDIPALDPSILSISIAAVTFIILGIAFFASHYKEALSQQQMEAARQLGMAEVSASVLHNVGNVLNSVNVSANLIVEKISHSQLDGLTDLTDLFNKHKHDLAEFITNDSNGTKVSLYLNKLDEYWRKEKDLIFTESTTLLRHIQHIKDIISVQQGITVMVDIEQVVLLDELINEALLITGLNADKREIIIIKNFEKIKPILIDKIKLLQVLVNLATNAKDALRSSTKTEKTLSITTSYKKTNHKIHITIHDNGIGIPSENLTKIFSYGFTTKKSGHGFGLHNCALSINEMGGSIYTESEGTEKGSTFTVELPYREH